MSGNSVWAWVIAGCVTAGSLLYYVLNQAGDGRLRAAGEPASARVLSVRQTGTWVNTNPEVALELEVTRSGSAPYRLTLKAVVPQPQLAAVQPGQALRIRVAADRPTRAVLDEPWAH